MLKRRRSGTADRIVAKSRAQTSWPASLRTQPSSALGFSVITSVRSRTRRPPGLPIGSRRALSRGSRIAAFSAGSSAWGPPRLTSFTRDFGRSRGPCALSWTSGPSPLPRQITFLHRVSSSSLFAVTRASFGPTSAKTSSRSIWPDLVTRRSSTRGRRQGVRHRKPRPRLNELRHGAELIDWVRNLPRPVGMMTCNNVRARQVLSACCEAGVRVPDEVGVVGVNNDELVCAFCDPPLSSVDLDVPPGGLRGCRHARPAHARRIVPAGHQARVSHQCGEPRLHGRRFHCRSRVAGVGALYSRACLRRAETR